MVGKTGFEPATPWSQTKCSTKLSHFPKKNGVLEGIRTPDLRLRRLLLYPAELPGHLYSKTEYKLIIQYIYLFFNIFFCFFYYFLIIIIYNHLFYIIIIKYSFNKKLTITTRNFFIYIYL